MNHLELFSGTFSFGKITEKYYNNIISLDKEIGSNCPLKSNYKSKKHFKEDIFSWNYKQYPKHYFHLITASPCCVYWSSLRKTNIGKISRLTKKPYTYESIEQDIIDIGIPMVEKVFEIIDYFEPKYFIIENPYTGRMKEYINDLIPFYVIDYCRYGFNYRKRTILWTNIEGFDPKLCNCKTKKHFRDVTSKGGGNNRLPRYLIPFKLIDEIILLTLD